MALGITVATILSNKTAAKSASTALADCTAVDGSAIVALGIEVLLTFNASATLGATVGVYTSSDGSNYTTSAVQTYSIPYSNATVRVAFCVLPGHKNYKVMVTNLDTGQSITAIYVNAEPQVLS
jgi:hypothetical protein